MNTQVLKILNLLRHRDVVSRNELIERCEVSERSIYRYMSQLSEAKIPIYFDDSKGGYMLHRAIDLPTNFLNDAELLLIRLGLDLLGRQLGRTHSSSLRNLILHLNKLSPVTNGYNFDSLTNLDAGGISDENLASSVTYLIIVCAIESEKSLTLKWLDPTGLVVRRTIRRPALEYDREWYVRDLAAKTDKRFLLNAVLECVVLA